MVINKLSGKMNVTETYNKRTAGMKQEILDMKNEFIKSLDGLICQICGANLLRLMINL